MCLVGRIEQGNKDSKQLENSGQAIRGEWRRCDICNVGSSAIHLWRKAIISRTLLDSRTTRTCFGIDTGPVHSFRHLSLLRLP